VIRACGPRLVLKLDEVESEEVSEGGIVIGLSKEKLLRRAAVEKGVVISVGSTCWDAFYYDKPTEPWCKVGDYISFARYAGKAMEDPADGEEYIVINDEDVVSVLETKEERDGRLND
jgi:co-chaperonin GroES (HSP10)